MIRFALPIRPTFIKLVATFDRHAVFENNGRLDLKQSRLANLKTMSKTGLNLSGALGVARHPINGIQAGIYGVAELAAWAGTRTPEVFSAEKTRIVDIWTNKKK